MSIKTTLKRDGSTEAYEPIKILKWVLWGSKGIESAIDWQELVQSVTSELYDGIYTQTIQLKVIEKCNARLSSNYDLLAGRLYSAHLRKKLFNNKLPSVKEHFSQMVVTGFMEEMGYTDDEYAQIEKIIDHSRDFTLLYSQVLQLYNKYSICNRVTGEKFETPQFIAMRMAMALSTHEVDKMKSIKENYDMFSLFKGSAPTPNYTNLGTPHRGLISCCLYTTDDTAESLAVGDHIAYTMTYMSAGIGGYLKTRSVGDPVKKGSVKHKGKINYYKAVGAAVNANTQQCYSFDTEILTENGFKYFYDLLPGEKVAQVHDDVSTTFVEPSERQVYDYSGPMYSYHSVVDDFSLCVTPNHRLAWVDGKKNVPNIQNTVAEEFKACNCKSFLYAASLPQIEDGWLGDLTSDEELTVILLAQRHAFSEDRTELSIDVNSLSLEKISELCWFLKRLEIDYEAVIVEREILSLKLVTNLSKLKTFTIKDKTYEELAAHYVFLQSWLDTNIDEGMVIESISKENADSIQALACLCGLFCKLEVNADLTYKVTVSPEVTKINSSKVPLSITIYDDKVYCVTVPTGNIIVRHKGITSVCGNSRGGACTQYFMCYDPEVIDLIHLQNPRTPQKKQIRDIHFAIEFNAYFYKKLEKKEDVFLFTCHSAPELHKAFFDKDDVEFARIYEALEADPTFKKTYMSSVRIAVAAGRQFHETATLYSANMTEINHHTPFLEPIYSSNLCTAPETPILTKEFGYQPIESLVNQKVSVWNGEEWSPVTVVQTGQQQKLLSVTVSTGVTWSFTPYHKWYVKTSDGVVVKQTDELLLGDELIDFVLHACDHGYTSVERTKTLPDNKYAIGYRTRCLSELFDKAGYFGVRDDKVALLGIYIKTKEAATNLLLLLQELGVYSAFKETWVISNKRTIANLINDKQLDVVYADIEGPTSTDTTKVYFLEIGTSGVNKLNSFGFGVRITDTHKTQGRIFSNFKQVDDSVAQHVVIESVDDHNRVDDTYCFSEPKRHMGMFGGVLTGQCTEITQVTKPYKSITDLYDPSEGEDKGEISLCGLGGIIPSNIYQEPHFDKHVRTSLDFDLLSDQEYFNVAYRQLKMISSCIRKNSYVFPHLKTTALGRMNAGVGMIGLAFDLAKKGYSYTSDEGIKYIHFLAERHAFMLILASLKIGQEEGNAPYMHKTKWPQGWLPIDTYNKNVDTIADFKLYFPWELLRQAVIANGGIAHSALITYMPTESCLADYTKIQTTDGEMSMKDIFLLTGLTLDDAYSNHEPVLGGRWYDLNKSITVNTRFGEKEVTRVWYNGRSPSVKITLENGDIVHSSLLHKHLVKTEDQPEAWVFASDIQTTDSLVSTTESVKIAKTEILDSGNIHFLDIEVPDVHEYILTNGIVTHNSSKAAGRPNAYYPLRDIHVLKTDESNAIDFIAPLSDEIGHNYQLAWNVPTLRMTQVCAVIQKFSDQSLSSDRYSDRTKNIELKASTLIDEIMYDYLYGVKSRYYTNSKTTDGKTLSSVQATNTTTPIQESTPQPETSRGCDGGFCTL